jgi:hypothetical protein
MVDPTFIVSTTSDKIWNQNELIKFLSNNQNKNITLIIEPEATCLRNLGLYKILDCFFFNSVTIKTWNPLENHNSYNIKYNGNNFWFTQTDDISETLQQWNLSKKFLCFYHRPTAARIGIASYIHENYCLESHIHFSIGTSENELLHYELDKLLHWNFRSIETAGRFIKKLPLILGTTSLYTAFNGYDYKDPLTNLYQDIFVDIVVESHVAGDTFFPTEKTIRPILLKKPFIMFASKNYLCYLRQMGFRTFSDFWDEDYDGYEGKDRLDKIINLIDWLATQPIGKLESMYWDMQYTLEHNYNLLVNKKYQTKITQI